MIVCKHPFLDRGFRPFFTLGAFYAASSILLWVLHWKGVFLAPAIFDDPVLWHGHEMIYGFTIAIIAGFLLTAIPNWTGTVPVQHIYLLVLVALWVSGRVVMIVPGIDFRLAATVDLAFIPCLAFSLAVPLLRSGNKQNFVFLLMLAVLFCSNLFLFIYQDKAAFYAAVLVVISMISLIGGRVIPSFTVATLRRKGVNVLQTPQPRADIAALVSLACILIAVLMLGVDSPVTGLLAFVSAAVHLLRLRHYHTHRVWSDPLLWSLHLGYLWLMAGLVLLGLSGFNLVTPSAALHAFTTGCIGSMTLSMMCRVALAHTGRNLIASPLTTFLFLSMQLVAFIRVCGPVVLPAFHGEWIMLSGGLWTLVFALYLLAYLPVLWSPRPDGRSE